MAQSINSRVMAAREAGNVRRCHTIPHHGEYTIGKHCFDCLNLLFILHPEPSVNLIKCMLHHDSGERWVGDLPAPAKWYNEEAAETHEVAEIAAMISWGFWDGQPNLTDEDRLWLKSIDLIEFYLWTLDQEAMGNRNVENSKRNVLLAMLHLRDEMPLPCKELVSSFNWRRLPDQYEESTENDE